MVLDGLCMRAARRELSAVTRQWPSCRIESEKWLGGLFLQTKWTLFRPCKGLGVGKWGAQRRSGVSLHRSCWRLAFAIKIVIWIQLGLKIATRVMFRPLKCRWIVRHFAWALTSTERPLLYLNLLCLFSLHYTSPFHCIVEVVPWVESKQIRWRLELECTRRDFLWEPWCLWGWPERNAKTAPCGLSLTSWQPFLGFLGFVERETLTPRIQMRFRVVKAKSAVLFRSCFKDLYTHVFLGMSECRAQMTAYSFNQRMGSSKMGRVNEIVPSARNEISISDRIRPGRWYFLHQRGNGQTIFSDGWNRNFSSWIYWPVANVCLRNDGWIWSGSGLNRFRLGRSPYPFSVCLKRSGFRTWILTASFVRWGVRE